MVSGRVATKSKLSTTARNSPSHGGRWTSIWTKWPIVERIETRDPTRTLAIQVDVAGCSVIVYGVVQPGQHGAVDEDRHGVHESGRCHRHPLEGDVERDGLNGSSDDRHPRFVTFAVGPAPRRGHGARPVLVRGTGLGQNEDVGAEVLKHDILGATSRTG